jgi:hypothetical protein
MRGPIFLYFGACELCVFWPFFGLPFLSLFDDSGHQSFVEFGVFLIIDVRSLSHLKNRFKNSHLPTPHHLYMFKFLIIIFVFHLVMGKTNVSKHSQNVGLDLAITLS